MSRLPPQPGERIDRSRPVGFTFDGKRVEALAGDTIASALFAAASARSRAASSTTAGAACCAAPGSAPTASSPSTARPACARAPSRCARAWRSSTSTPPPASSTTSWRSPTPSAARSRRRASTTRPSSARGGCGRCTRRCCATPPASGKLRASQDEREWRTEYRRRHADVLVVGGGLAGLRAAIAAAEAGADVVLADEGPEPGGRALAEGGHERARELAEQARARRRRGPHLGLGAGLLRRPRRRLAGLDPAPGPRAPARLRHRRRRAAARLRRQRPARRDALRRRAAADRALRHRAGDARGDRHHVGSRAGGGARAGGRRRRGRVADAPTCARAAQRVARGRGAARHVRGRAVPRRALGRQRRARASSATCWSCRAAWRRRPRSSRRPAGAPPTTRARGHFALAELPDGVHAAGAVAGAGDDPERSGQRAGAQAAHALGLGEAPPPRAGRRGRAPRARGRAARRGRRRAREVLRLPVRGRHGQGHPPQRRGGLRLDRALQALHDGDHGPLPGAHVPAARGAAHGPGDRAGPPERRHHHRAPAVVGGPARRAGRPPDRARQALGHPSPPPRARRPRHVGRRLAPRLRLRRPAGRGAGRPRERRAHRRLHAGQAHRARPRGRRLPRSPLPQPLRQPQARAHPLRRADLRRRADHRRRHDLPPGRRELLRHHHLERRRRGRAVVLLVAGRLAHAGHAHRRHPGARRGQPRRAARPRDHGRASPTSTAPTRPSPTSTPSARRSPASRR